MQDPYRSRNHYSSLYRGVVESNIDPENLGRCKIRVPSIHGELNYSIDMLPWARPLVLSPIKSGRGSVNLPDVKDIVWVLFEGANKEFPIYLGGTYAKGELDVSNSIVDFYVEGIDRVYYTRDTRNYKIKIGDDTFVLVTPELVHINKQDHYIKVTPELIHIDTKGNFTKVKPDEIHIDTKGDYVKIRPGEIHIDTGGTFLKVNPGLIHMKGNVLIEGNVNVKGTVSATGDVTGQGTSLHNHVHGGVTIGDDSTGKPV